MPESVFVIGTSRTDFKRNLLKENKSIRDLVVEVGRLAIADAAIQPSDIGAGIVGNFAAGMFTKQLHLGSMLTDIDPALVGIPTLHAEAACASGGAAMISAVEKILSNQADVVLVVGVEQQKTMSPVAAADVLGAAADFAAEKSRFGEYLFPSLFGHVAEIYAERYGLTEEDLGWIAAKASAHGRLNPLAQMRDRIIEPGPASLESRGNPRIAGLLKLTDCSQITDGAAAVIVCSERFAKSLPPRPDHPAVRLAGFGQTSDYLDLARKPIPEFPVSKRAAAKAYAMANWTPADLHGAEVHDCFSITEILGVEVLGLAETGKAASFAKLGITMLPKVRKDFALANPKRSIPINPGGGLMADGHPVGATGVRQIDEMFRQLTHRAEDRQIPHAKKYATLNIGGSLTTTIVMLWEAQ